MCGTRPPREEDKGLLSDFLLCGADPITISLCVSVVRSTTLFLLGVF